MPKVEGSIPGLLHRLASERIEEEGITWGQAIREALTLWVGEDAEPKAKQRPQLEYGNLVQKSVGLPNSYWQLWGIKSDEEGYKTLNDYIRELARVDLGLPEPPPKPPRAPRNPKLSRDIIFEAQVESFNDMRNLRTSQEGKEKPVELPVWERIRANPEEFFHVNLCRVKGCHNQDMGLHRHPGMHLADYADAVEEGGRT